MNLFPIQISVEDPMVGEVLRILNSLPGVAKINLNLDGLPKKKTGRLPGVSQPSSPPPGTAPERVKSPGRAKAAEVIVGALMSGPKATSEIRQILHQQGFFGISAAANTLTALRNRGITETAGQGAHKLTDEAMRKLRKSHGAIPTDVLALPAPPEKAPAKKARIAKKAHTAKPEKKPEPEAPVAKKRGTRGRPQHTGHDMLLAYMRRVKTPVARTVLRDYLVTQGFSPGSIDNFAHVLRGKKLIHSPEPGLYALLEPTTTAHQGE